MSYIPTLYTFYFKSIYIFSKMSENFIIFTFFGKLHKKYRNGLTIPVLIFYLFIRYKITQILSVVPFLGQVCEQDCS